MEIWWALLHSRRQWNWHDQTRQWVSVWRTLKPGDEFLSLTSNEGQHLRASWELCPLESCGSSTGVGVNSPSVAEAVMIFNLV